jgi:kynurenine formamidase
MALTQQRESSTPQRPSVTKDQVDRWMKELSNWGRWGKEDQLGAVNLITPGKRTQALALAKSGLVVSLAHEPPLTPKPEAADSTSAYLEIRSRVIAPGFVMERQELAFHGSTYTHLDALCHAEYNGKVYNGFLLQDVVKENGCAKLGINGLHGGIVTRGVLIDIPRLKGVPHLERGTHVYPEDIEAWEKKAGVKIAAGDAIFLRTGRWASRGQLGSGYDVTVAPWLKARDVALVGSDGTQDVGTVEGIILPFHKFVLVALGSNIFDNADLERVAETAARLNRWEFLLVAAPIPNPGGTGSPLNPLAIF